ncbi:MAG TPA: aryl-sulfate sulfotransferase, partial [bacterium]|nr:aryl-sulfate sulfotransferase [bacterium]
SSVRNLLNFFWGNFNNGSLERGFSRVIEYKLDFENMTAEISFIYDGTNDGRMWFTEYWGDADSLPNGNIFVTAGDYQLYSNSRLFEVTREGEVVWELFMDKQEDWIVALYNAQKFVPPLKRLD